MTEQTLPNQTIWGLVMSGGFAMYPLVICSLIVWGVIFERLWTFGRLGKSLKVFHLDAMTALLRNDLESVKALCVRFAGLPTARLLLTGIERITSTDRRRRARWVEAVERQRQVLNYELKQNLWLLGTIGSASPFIGLFGTVVGILRSFQEMAKSGSGGFAVVAAGISESLIATAAGIVVAVIAFVSYNAFQTRWNSIVLAIRVDIEELAEILASTRESEEGMRAAGSSHGV